MRERAKKRDDGKMQMAGREREREPPGGHWVCVYDACLRDGVSESNERGER
jgi:hypothetical protein